MENKCAICGTEERLIRPSMNDFVRVCEEHKDYKADFQFDKTKLDLGYIQKLPDSNCVICNKQLSNHELESIDKKDFTKTCDEHRWMAKYYAIFDFVEIYKAGLPFILQGRLYSKEHPEGTMVEEYKNPANECVICGDKESLIPKHENHFSRACKQHEEYATCWMKEVIENVKLDNKID